MADDATLIPGPDGEMITEAEHQRLHRMAVYCAPPPPGVTEAAQRYLAHGHEMVHYSGALIKLALKMDDTLAALGWRPPEVICYADAIKPYSRLQVELLLSRIVDLFLTYTADLLSLIFTTRPETLRSGAQVRLDYVLRHANMEDLVRGLADQQVNELAFKGFAQLHETLEKQLGFTLLKDGNLYSDVVHLVECRNLITHNYGTVNDIFRTRVRDCRQPVGEKVDLPGWDYRTELAHAMLDIDARARDKFGIPSSTLESHRRMCGVLGR